MEADNNRRKIDVRDFLLEEYRNLTESFWRNEQSGETRVNWFIGLVTAVAAGLVLVATAEHGPRGEALRNVVVASLFSLLVLGVLTLFRILRRNETTDGYKRGCDAIRQLFKDHFDSNQILLHYEPFGLPQYPRRKLAGLAYLVAALNSLLLGALIGAAVYPMPNADTGPADLSGWTGVYVTVALAFGFGAVLQLLYIPWREEKAKTGLRSVDPTHAGGIVFRINSGTVQYLLVGPKKDVPNEWLFPKGHLNDNEPHGSAASREVKEETGVVARLICLVGSDSFKIPKEEVRVKYYLMEGLFVTGGAESRRVKWFPFDEALKYLTHYQNKYMLHEAERKRTALYRSVD